MFFHQWASDTIKPSKIHLHSFFNRFFLKSEGRCFAVGNQWEEVKVSSGICKLSGCLASRFKLHRLQKHSREQITHNLSRSCLLLARGNSSWLQGRAASTDLQSSCCSLAFWFGSVQVWLRSIQVDTEKKKNPTPYMVAVSVNCFSSCPTAAS